MGYFVYDCDQGDIETYETEEIALEKAEEALDYYRDNSTGDGWPEGFQIQVGVVTHELVMVDRQDQPDDFDDDGISAATGEYWDSEWSYRCDFQLKPIAK